MQKKFKRSTQSRITDIFGVLVIIVGVVLAYIQFTTGFGGAVKTILVLMVYVAVFTVMAILLGLVFALTPPDFSYTIKSVEKFQENYIIFKMVDDDIRRINRNFSVTKKSRRYLVLDDGITIIRIPYNKAVVQFLLEIID